MTERNAERLADALCRMRGAALKLGQMISIQDESVLPPQVVCHSKHLNAISPRLLGYCRRSARELGLASTTLNTFYRYHR